MQSAKLYRKSYGYSPFEILMDAIYCNRKKMGRLKDMGIKIFGKPFLRPSDKNRVEFDPGDLNPIKGKYGYFNLKMGCNLPPKNCRLPYKPQH